MPDRKDITLLDVDGWVAHLRTTGETLHVYVNDEDVTTDCYRVVRHADGVHGDAFVFLKNTEGKHFLDQNRNRPASGVKTGVLRIVPGTPFNSIG